MKASVAFRHEGIVVPQEGIDTNMSIEKGGCVALLFYSVTALLQGATTTCAELMKRTGCPLWVDTVAKVENRPTQKISRKLITGLRLFDFER
jgi:hypothetical protein